MFKFYTTIYQPLFRLSFFGIDLGGGENAEVGAENTNDTLNKLEDLLDKLDSKEKSDMMRDLRKIQDRYRKNVQGVLSSSYDNYTKLMDAVDGNHFSYDKNAPSLGERMGAWLKPDYEIENTYSTIKKTITSESGHYSEEVNLVLFEKADPKSDGASYILKMITEDMGGVRDSEVKFDDIKDLRAKERELIEAAEAELNKKSRSTSNYDSIMNFVD